MGIAGFFLVTIWVFDGLFIFILASVTEHSSPFIGIWSLKSDCCSGEIKQVWTVQVVPRRTLQNEAVGLYRTLTRLCFRLTQVRPAPRATERFPESIITSSRWRTSWSSSRAGRFWRSALTKVNGSLERFCLFIAFPFRSVSHPDVRMFPAGWTVGRRRFHTEPL